MNYNYGYPISYGSEKSDGLGKSDLIRILKVLVIIIPIVYWIPQLYAALETKNKTNFIGSMFMNASSNSISARPLQPDDITGLTAKIIIIWCFTSIVLELLTLTKAKF